MRKALISVYNKQGIVEFAKELVALGWQIYSSGGTAKVLTEAGVGVTDVASLSGLPPILGHRVVTLVPQVHGGLLATEQQRGELEKLGFPWIDLVCVDLYPLKEEIDLGGATVDSVIEKTDIGGPALLRSAAKGRRIVIADIEDRRRVLDWLRKGEPDAECFLNELAAKAEFIVADYCLASARFHSLARLDGLLGQEMAVCKYGENAWQVGAGLFAGEREDPLALSRFELLEGDSPSYNNWCDVDRLLQTVTHLAAVYELNGREGKHLAVAVKHGNACGVGVAENSIEALQKMLAGDLLAVFGGVVMTNFAIGQVEAETLRQWQVEQGKRLLDGVVAVDFDEPARIELNRKGGKCRMLRNPALGGLGAESLDKTPRYRYVRGGFLRQPNYDFVLNLNDPELEVVGQRVATDLESDLLLAWAVGSTSNSNTIVLVRKGMLLGNAVGQQDRVGAAKLVIERARRSNHEIGGSVTYSDSFFPFPDGPRVLIERGVRAILASKGSINDEAVRNVCRGARVSLYLLPDHKVRGFFGH